MSHRVHEGSVGLQRQNFTLEVEREEIGHCELRGISDNMEEVNF